MSTIRDDIAAALSSVEVAWDNDLVPITGFPAEVEPASWQAWVGWPAWRDTRWLNACVAEDRWYVLVVVPSGDALTFSAAMEAVKDPVRDALLKVGHVELAEASALVASDNTATVPAVRYSLTT